MSRLIEFEFTPSVSDSFFTVEPETKRRLGYSRTELPTQMLLNVINNFQTGITDLDELSSLSYDQTIATLSQSGITYSETERIFHVNDSIAFTSYLLGSLFENHGPGEMTLRTHRYVNDAKVVVAVTGRL